MLASIIHWFEHNMLECSYVKHIGIECPGCGIQRSLIAFLKGDFLGSLMLYPALLPILFMFGFLIVHLIFKFKKGGIVLKYSFISCSIIIIASYLVKLIA